MKVLLVVCHARPTSLTHDLARAFATGIEAKGHVVEWADLYAEGFDPALGPEDEPDWNDPAKVYSPAVRAEMRRVERNEATVIVFPVWWWSLPAMLKGWIDRVWNQGWAYSGNDYPHPRVWMLGLAGGDRQTFTKRNYDGAMRIQIETGILDYCGVTDPRFQLIYGAEDGEPVRERLLSEIRAAAAEF